MMTRLGDVCTVISGSTPKTSVAEYWDGDIKWITPAELNEDSFYLYDSQRHITELGKEKTGLSYMPIGTVILSSRAPIGKTAIAGCEMCCNQGFKNLICSDDIFNEYLYYFLKGKTDYLNSLGRGATFKEISKSIVENIEIRLPALEEQKQIARQFGEIYRLISLRKQQLAKLDELVKARFVELFGDVANSPKYSGVPLGTICSTLSGGTPTTKVPEYYQGDIPWISTPYLGNNHINGSSAKAYITEDAIKNSATHLIPANTIMFGIRVGVGKSSIIDEPMCANQDIVALMGIDTNKYNLLFVKHALDSYQSHFDSIKKGATILGITTDDLKKVLIPNVDIGLQNQFATFVEQTDKSKLTVQQSLDKMELLKKALMQKYFG